MSDFKGPGKIHNFTINVRVCHHSFGVSEGLEM
jgi:hypothetical protein